MPRLRNLVLLCLVSIAACGCGGGDPSLSAQAAPLTPITTLDSEAFRQELTSLFQQSGAKAMLATVRQGDREVVTLALGESMTDVAASRDDHIRIGGISETFWGTIVMLLVERGDIKLEDKISKWLPDLLSADQVTVGMLLNNMGGYKDYVHEKSFVDDLLANPYRAFSRDDIINYAVSGGQMQFPPGTDQQYSHTEFTIMGKLIEKATGQTMEELHKQLLFGPAGLTQTGYSKNALLPEPVLHAFSSEREVYEDSTYWNPTWTGDSGPLYSTLDEVARWVRIHGQGKLLTPASFARLTAKPAIINDDATYYIAGGFVVSNGWFVQNPNFNGYSGAYGYLPAEDITIVIYTTETRDPKSYAAGFSIFKKLVASLLPSHTIPG